MRYAVVSDIHANLQAWESVFTDIRSVAVDEIVCLGDVVGYGPAPVPVLEHVYAYVHHLTIGNHDAAVCGQLDSAWFSVDSRRTLDWTREQLDAKAEKFLAELPYVWRQGPVAGTHGEFSAPRAFNYVRTAREAQASWEAALEPLLFIGHSHVPGIFVRGGSGRAHWLPPRDFRLEEGKRYLVNVGSVGQPRDGDMRACYVIFDADLQAVYFRRVPFDVRAYVADLEHLKLPVHPSVRRNMEKYLSCEPIRERQSFRASSSGKSKGGSERKRSASRRRRSRTTELALDAIAAATEEERAEPEEAGTHTVNLKRAPRLAPEAPARSRVMFVTTTLLAVVLVVLLLMLLYVLFAPGP